MKYTLIRIFTYADCFRVVNESMERMSINVTAVNEAQSVDCDCGEPHTMAHLLSCRLLDDACTADDLATVTERAKACARKWEKLCEGHERRRRLNSGASFIVLGQNPCPCAFARWQNPCPCAFTRLMGTGHLSTKAE